MPYASDQYYLVQIQLSIPFLKIEVNIRLLRKTFIYKLISLGRVSIIFLYSLDSRSFNIWTKQEFCRRFFFFKAF